MEIKKFAEEGVRDLESFNESVRNKNESLIRQEDTINNPLHKEKVKKHNKQDTDEQKEQR